MRSTWCVSSRAARPRSDAQPAAGRALLSEPFPKLACGHTKLTLEGAAQSAFGPETGCARNLNDLQVGGLQERARHLATKSLHLLPLRRTLNRHQSPPYSPNRFPSSPSPTPT